MQEDILKAKYSEKPKTFSQFPNSATMLDENKKFKKRGSNKNRQELKSSTNKLLKLKQNNKNDLAPLEKTAFIIGKGLRSIVDNSTKLVGIVATIGLTLFSLQGILRKLEYLEPDQSLFEGVGTRIGGRVGDKFGASGRSLGHISEKGIQFIANEEGLRTEAYKDSKGIWTIGIGHTGKVDGKPITAGMKITEAKAKELFKQDIQKYENHVNQVVKVPVSQNMFDAMVSYAFNVGSLGQNFIKKINSGDYRGAMNELTTVNKELQNRRKREQALFGIDITADNKLGGTEINPQIKSQDVLTSKVADFNSLSKVKEVSAGGGSAKTYDSSSNITSHTKLSSGTNQFYNANAKTSEGLGTFHGKTITSGIGSRNVKGGSSFHRGIDLAYNFEDVRAFCSGTVTFAGIMGGFGRCVIINDSRGFRHVYGHLSAIKVSVGRYVKKGDIIGKSGRSGTDALGRLIENCYAPHLHYGLWRPGGTRDKYDYVDPRTYTYPDDDGYSPQTNSANINKAQQNNKNIPKAKKPVTQNTQPQQKTGGNTTVKVTPPKNTTSKYNNTGSITQKKQAYNRKQTDLKNRK